MSWLLFTILSIGARAIYGVMTKVFSNKIKTSAYTQAILLPLAAVLITILVSPFLGGISFDFSQVSWTVLFLVIFGQGLGNIVYFAAIKDLTNATAQIAFSSILAFNTLLALLFLGLHLSPVNLFGLVLLMVGIFTAISGKIELNKRGVALMIFSAFLFSIFQLASAQLSKQIGAATYLLIAYGGAAIVVFTLKWKVVIKDLSQVERPKLIIGVPLLTAIPSLGNFVFAYYAYRIAPQPAKVAMLLTSQVVLTVFLSYFFLNEKTHFWRKVAAAFLVVIAAILIKD